MHSVPLVVSLLRPSDSVPFELFLSVCKLDTLSKAIGDSLRLSEVVRVVSRVAISIAPSPFLRPLFDSSINFNAVDSFFLNDVLEYPFVVLGILPTSVHELELLEVFLVEDVEQVLLLPERSWIGSVDVLHELKFACESVLLVNARPVHEVLEIGAVRVGNGEHRRSEGGKLHLVCLAFILAASFEISRFEDKPTHHTFHDFINRVLF